MKYRLMAVDVDGTLLDSRNNLSDETLKAIRLGVDKGLIFTICTGRSINGVQNLNSMIGLDMPFVTYNGAMVIMGKSMDILYERRLSPKDARTIYDLGKKYGTTMVVWADNKLYVNKLNNVTAKYGSLNNTSPVAIENLDDVVKNGVSKILWYDEEKRIEEFEREVGKYVGSSVNYHTSQPIFLEFVNREASKAIAIEKLCDHFGIRRSETIAVGDASNDISMIEYAGLGVAMANASDAVKERADYVTHSNDENGVAHVIYKFVLEL